jgi:hypothetical protein
MPQLALALQLSHTNSPALPLPRTPLVSLLALVPSLLFSCKCLLVKGPVSTPDHFMISSSGYGIA